jgi:hypothetical protein
MKATRPLWNMFSRALEHLPLRYTLIAVSAWLYDGLAGRSRERSLVNLRKAIPLIQKAVSSTALDDGHGFAVFLLAYLSIVRGDVKGISLHTGGFYRILRFCNVLREDGSPTLNQTSLSMILWRIAIRAENISGFIGPRTAFPATNVSLDIQRATAKGQKDGITELNLQLDLAFLVRDLEAWKCRLVLRAAESRERIRRTIAPTTPSMRFLEHEPLTFADEVYAIMLTQYFTVRIQVSLISSPQLGPHPSDRYMFAVELCRVYAAIGGLRRPGLMGLLVGLFYAGLALTDKSYPLGI